MSTTAKPADVMARRSGPVPLALSSVRVRFGGNVVLEDVSLAFEKGINGLVGPNGAGKTTVFNVISGYVRPVSGTVEHEGTNILRKSPAAVGRRGIARTFQAPRLIGDMSVLHNVMLGAHRTYRTGHLRELLGTPAARRDERAAREASLRLLATFGLESRALDDAGSLSLGSQKVVEIARALVGSPSVLLLDEPAAGLSAPDVAEMVAGIWAVVAERELTVVMIEHDLRLVSTLCSHLSVLHFGRIIAEGLPSEVVQDAVVIEAYLGTRKEKNPK